MEITEHRYPCRRVAMVLMDGRRLVVKARPVYSTGTYLITAPGLCLLDKQPHPMAPNKMGVVNPHAMEAKNLKEVRRIVHGLANTGKRRGA